MDLWHDGRINPGTEFTAHSQQVVTGRFGKLHSKTDSTHYYLTAWTIDSSYLHLFPLETGRFSLRVSQPHQVGGPVGDTYLTRKQEEFCSLNTTLSLYRTAVLVLTSLHGTNTL
jgi:hypothetical protein